MKLAVLKEVLGEVRSQLAKPRRAVLAVTGLLLATVGTIGMFIPLFPGRTLLITGLLLVSLLSPTAYALLKRRSSGHPRLESLLDRLRNWLLRRLL